MGRSDKPKKKKSVLKKGHSNLMYSEQKSPDLVHESLVPLVHFSSEGLGDANFVNPGNVHSIISVSILVKYVRI